jgi:hypothetical protein
MSLPDRPKGSAVRPDEPEEPDEPDEWIEEPDGPPEAGEEVVVVEMSEDFGKTVTRVTGGVAQVNKVLKQYMDAKQPFAQKHFPALVGIAFLVLTLALAFAFAHPNRLQRQLILSMAALGGGAFSLEFAKRIDANMSLGKKLSIIAGGAGAVFVILYFFVPAGLD